MRTMPLILLIVLLSGCGDSAPTMAGGKPVGHWVQALRDPSAKVRKHAAFKLGNAGAADATVFPALLGALRDVDAPVRSEAILAVLKFGPRAKEAVPILTELQERDHDSQVRTYAAKALAKIRGGK